MHCIELCPFLVAALCKSIRRKKITLSALSLRQIRFVAVYGRRRCIYKLFNTALSCRFEHIERSLNIVFAIKQRHFKASRNASPSSLIENIVHALACLHAGVKVFNIAFDKLVIRIIKEHINIFLLAR